MAGLVANALETVSANSLVHAEITLDNVRGVDQMARKAVDLAIEQGAGVAGNLTAPV